MVILILILMLILLTLIVLASAQCPGCLAQNCTISQGGFSNCSACMSGYMLVSNVVNLPPSASDEGTPYTSTVYSCQACPQNCLQCSVGVRTPLFSFPFMSVNCDNCPSGYTLNFTTGGCAACPPNCQNCGCWGDLCLTTGCYYCNSGYVVDNNAQCIPQPSTPTVYSSPYCAQGGGGYGPAFGLNPCGQCQYGTDVPVSVITTTQSPLVFLICQLCPAYCLTCQFSNITTAQNTTIYGLACYTCVAGAGLNGHSGCEPCPEYCSQCSPLNYSPNQYMITCTQCNPGFTLNEGLNGQGYCEYDGTTQVDNAVNPYPAFTAANTGFLLYSACPFCQPGACTITPNGYGNCSQCSLQQEIQPVQFWVQISSDYGIYNGGPIGICRQCPPGCSKCYFQQTTGAILCNQCTSSAVTFPNNNTCYPCLPNCATCQLFVTGTSCLTCNPGYWINNGSAIGPFTCSPNTINLQDSSGSNSNIAAIIGLSIWGVVMTIVSATFIYLWYKKSQSTMTEPLLNSIEPRTVSF